MGDIQNSRDRDEDIVAELVALIGTPGTVPENLEHGIFAAHAVAAAVNAALIPNANVDEIFNRMLDILKRMHDRNPSWGPLFVMHPGDLAHHRAYMPQAAGSPCHRSRGASALGPAAAVSSRNTTACRQFAAMASTTLGTYLALADA